MTREILQILSDILKDDEVRELIYNQSIIPYQQYMTVRDYIDKKLEETYLKERLHDIHVEIKQYEGNEND